MLVIKTGMQSEYDIAKRYADPSALILTGIQTAADLKRNVPQNCTGIISFGLCGQLSGEVIGQAFIYDLIRTPAGDFMPDPDWRKRLFAATRYVECRCWSSGKFNTANTIADRAALYAQTGCCAIDDETYAVAGFAAARNIPFIGLRVVSDGAEDNLPSAVLSALNPDGTTDIEAVVLSVIKDPLQVPALIKTAREYEKSLGELRRAIIDAGPLLQAP
jgi:adenosylhomocysteine nucleosidase